MDNLDVGILFASQNGEYTMIAKGYCIFPNNMIGFKKNISSMKVGNKHQKKIKVNKGELEKEVSPRYEYLKNKGRLTNEENEL